MKISDQGLKFIASFEGFRSKPYYDSVKVVTIGYGTIVYPNGKKVKITDPPITMETALSYKLNHIETKVYPVLSKQFPEPLKQHQFDALVSIAYNVGTGILIKSTLKDRIKENANDKLITDAFMMWKKAGGVVSKGLTIRRREEAQLFTKGDYIVAF